MEIELNNEIEVLEIQRTSNGKALKAGPLLVRDVRIVEPEGGSRFVTPPQRMWKGRDGKTRSTFLVEFEEPLRSAIQQAVLSAYDGGEARQEAQRDA